MNFCSTRVSIRLRFVWCIPHSFQMLALTIAKQSHCWLGPFMGLNASKHHWMHFTHNDWFNLNLIHEHNKSMKIYTLKYWFSMCVEYNYTGDRLLFSFPTDSMIKFYFFVFVYLLFRCLKCIYIYKSLMHRKRMLFPCCCFFLARAHPGPNIHINILFNSYKRFWECISFIDSRDL